MYVVKTPSFIPLFFPHCTWKIPVEDNSVFLTFDDGPTPGVTDWILDQLKIYGAKATFFCVGNQVSKFPFLLKRIFDEGHTIGNHTYTHLHGWKSNKDSYIYEIKKTNEIIEKVLGFQPQYFRPPYGKFSRTMRDAILETHKIIMWDVLAGDFDSQLSSDNCILNVLSTFEKGSIIVLHDSLKCKDKIKNILPPLLSFFHNSKFKMSSI